VYDYLDAFEGAVISDPDHCMVVELRAWGCVALLGVRVGASHSAARRGLAIGAGEAAGGDSPGEGDPQVSLFSGLVGSDAMQAAYRRLVAAAPQPLLRLGGGGGAAAAERIVMAGPGGRGRVEVAVSEPAAEPGTPKGSRLQCCVMSVCLPWDALARDVLFKPPVGAA